MKLAENLKIGIKIDVATSTIHRRIEETTTHREQGPMKRDGSHTTIR